MLGASLLALGTALADTPLVALGKPDQITVDKRNNVLQLSWSDTEERLQGALQPDVPREGQPLKVQLNVGSFEGADFEGPITVTLREAGVTHGQVRTLTKGPVNWTTEFIPERDGRHQLDVSFRTTRLKVLHADFDVAPTLIPRVILWSLLGLAAFLALVFGVRGLLRKEKAPEVHPILAELQAAEAAPVPTSTPPSPDASPQAPVAAPENAPVAESSTGSAPDKPSVL
ncbi:hypothetical protein [Hyalangium rubrum]|uniref:Uncharacterized protein n=1 Tax=Hyalangium rubrum TaxID=3103134 RepID=A0ABU5GVU3_9BACT|nr:hypothetical protein [Hyalangium sp. s54d21]MDY7225300.1 hypothetical protein [Hyalangium sp. s54d21]